MRNLLACYFTSIAITCTIFIVTLTDSRPLAEDIVQDTFLKIWLLREQLTGIENFKSYLFRMARNAVLNSVKRKSTEARILQENFSAPGFQETPFEQVHYSEVKEVIQAAVAELPQKQKLIYLLRREEGKMPREIAVQLGLSVHTVNKQLATAQKKLRDAIYTAFPTDATVLLIISGWHAVFEKKLSSRYQFRHLRLSFILTFNKES